MNDKQSAFNSHGNRRGGRGWVRVASKPFSDAVKPSTDSTPSTSHHRTSTIRPPPRPRTDSSPIRRPRKSTHIPPRRPLSSSPTRKPSALTNRPRNAPWNRSTATNSNLNRSPNALSDRRRMGWNVKKTKPQSLNLKTTNTVNSKDSVIPNDVFKAAVNALVPSSGSKKKKKKEKGSRSKSKKESQKEGPSTVNLCDFIEMKMGKKRRKKKKVPFSEKLVRRELAFRLKTELNKHPLIIKQHKMRLKRIEKAKRLKAERGRATKEKEDDGDDDGDENEIESKIESESKCRVKDEEEAAPKRPESGNVVNSENAISSTSKSTKSWRSTSTKKRIRSGRVQRAVIETVSFLVDSVCFEEVDVYGDGKVDGRTLSAEQKRKRRARRRQKESEKMMASQPELIEQRKAFRDLHCGPHCNVMKYAEIGSYAEHLCSNELEDRIGFLLDRLGALSVEKERRFYLCGMRECLKALRAHKAAGVILSSQMEAVAVRGCHGLDKMMEDIIALCSEQRVEVIYGLNRKQINFVLKLKPWRGTVAAVTVLDLQKYQSTWNRIVEIQRALRHQLQTMKHDFIPIFRAIDTLKITDSARTKMQNVLNPNQQTVDILDDGKEQMKEERVKKKEDDEEKEQKTECKMKENKEGIDLNPKVKAPMISMESKLSAMTPAFEPRARTQWIQQNLNQNGSTFSSHLGAQSIVLHSVKGSRFDFGRGTLYQRQ